MITNEPLIQSFGVEASALLALIHGDAFSDPQIAGPAWSEAAFSSLLQSPGVRALVALDAAGQPAGLVLLRIVLDEAEILTFGVRAAARRQGIGRRLVAATLKEARLGDVTTLFLDVAETNLPARTLYEQSGFRLIGKRRNYFCINGRTIDALVLSLPL